MLWPVHPQPLDDELLSSWMIRLAHGNGFKIHNFFAEFFGRERQIWTRDIDHHAPDWLLEGLAARSGIPTANIERMTLRAYESFAFERFNETGNTRWIMPLGVYHRTRRAHGLQFCPRCVTEDEPAYLRRSWRLALCTACARHGVLLQDRCAGCQRPLVPHRADVATRRTYRGRLSLSRCTFCRSDLADTPVAVSEEDLNVQRRVDAALQSGTAWIGGQPLYSTLFFDGLRLLMLGIKRTESKTQGSHQRFEKESASSRLAQLSRALAMTERWPQAFLEHCGAIPHPYTTFSRDAQAIPYWLAAVMRTKLFQGTAPLSIAEAESIAVVADRVVGSRAPTALRRVSGRDVGHLLRPAPPTNAVASRLMRVLDAQIAQCSGRCQALLMRDKVMFAVARAFHLTMPELLDLTRPAFDVSEITGFDLGGSINTKRRALTALKWYCHEVRPRLVRDTETTALFLTNAGQAVQPGTLGMRFDRATRNADLISALPSWSRWIGCRRLDR